VDRELSRVGYVETMKSLGGTCRRERHEVGGGGDVGGAAGDPTERDGDSVEGDESSRVESK
jgi:hypothetical protein